jgi:multiple sugar transport system substrate-binding protein
MSRREMLRLAASAAGATAIGSLLAACGGGATPATPPTSAPAAAAPTAAPAAAAATAAPAPAEATAAPAEATAAPAAEPTAEVNVATAPTATPQPAMNFGSESAKVKIRYWTILGSVDGIVMNDLVKKFSEENPDIAVESLQGLTDFIQKMQASGISGTAPDVALVRHTYIGPFVDKNILSPFETGELEAAGIKEADYDPTVWKFTQYQGKQYTVPLDIHLHAMLHNKKILADNGLQVPTTLDEWLAAVTKVTKDDIIGYNTFALGAGAQEYMTWYIHSIWAQYGVKMISDDGTKAAFNTPDGITAIKWMKDMQDKGNPKNVPTGDLARTGKVATWADGPWISTLFFDKTKAPAADDIDAAPLPQHDPNKKAVWAQSHQFSLPVQGTPDPERRAASLKFILWMSQHSVDWAKAGQVPARNSARDEALKSDNIFLQKLKTWASELPYAAFIPSHPKLLEVMPRIAANVEGAMLNQWSIEEGLKKAEDEVNQILAG